MIDVKVPDLPESVDSATIIEIHAAKNSSVLEDQLLFELETDKIILEVTAPKSGALVNIYAESGATVNAGDKLCQIDPSIVPKAENAPKKNPPSEAQKNTPSEEKKTPSTNKSVRLDEKNHLTPSMRQSGVVSKSVVSTRSTRQIPMTRIRQKIAENLLSVQRNAAILTTFNEVNMKPVMDIRSHYKDRFLEKHQTKLGFMSFFTQACSQALREFESLNARIQDNTIIYHDYQDIGIAMSTERGLIVPVLRNVENMSFSDVENGIVQFAQKAKQNKIQLGDLKDGTFTITNGGTFGSLLSTPIINPPQSAILGMHSINKKPWVEDDQVLIRPIMMLALSYDHRIIDGREAVLFLRMVKELLEDPIQLLLDL